MSFYIDEVGNKVDIDEKNPLQNQRNCFVCNAELDADEEKCPQCSATNILPEVKKETNTEPRNPNVHKYWTRSGQVVSNRWIITGVYMMLIFGFLLIMILFGDKKGWDFCLLFILVGFFLFGIGKYKIHLGKLIVREEDARLKTQDSNYQIDEEINRKDIFDKIKNLFSKKSKQCKSCTQLSVNDRLIQLKKLLDNNVITREEYDDRRNKIIDQL